MQTIHPYLYALVNHILGRSVPYEEYEAINLLDLVREHPQEAADISEVLIKHQFIIPGLFTGSRAVGVLVHTGKSVEDVEEGIKTFPDQHLAWQQRKKEVFDISVSSCGVLVLPKLRKLVDHIIGRAISTEEYLAVDLQKLVTEHAEEANEISEFLLTNVPGSFPGGRAIGVLILNNKTLADVQKGVLSLPDPAKAWQDKKDAAFASFK